MLERHQCKCELGDPAASVSLDWLIGENVRNYVVLRMNFRSEHAQLRDRVGACMSSCINEYAKE